MTFFFYDNAYLASPSKKTKVTSYWSAKIECEENAENHGNRPDIKALHVWKLHLSFA